MSNIGNHENVPSVPTLEALSDLFGPYVGEDMVFAISELTTHDVDEPNSAANNVSIRDVGDVGAVGNDDDATGAIERAGDESEMGSSDYGTASEEAETGSDVVNHMDVTTTDADLGNTLPRISE
jgi:hypothetical protein